MRRGFCAPRPTTSRRLARRRAAPDGSTPRRPSRHPRRGMADEPDYAVRIATWVARALGDSAPLFERFSTDHLGVNLPATVVQAPDVATALQQAASGARDVGTAGATLETAAS